jgi:hypothetical protein
MMKVYGQAIDLLDTVWEHIKKLFLLIDGNSDTPIPGCHVIYYLHKDEDRRIDTPPDHRNRKGVVRTGLKASIGA